MNGAEWQRILPELRARYVGGDFEEHFSTGEVFRGPIDAVELNESTLTIVSSWCARQKDDGWVAAYTTDGGYGLDKCTEPRQAADGCLTFVWSNVTIIFIPRDGNKLNISSVRRP